MFFIKKKALSSLNSLLKFKVRNLNVFSYLFMNYLDNIIKTFLISLILRGNINYVKDFKSIFD